MIHSASTSTNTTHKQASAITTSSTTATTTTTTTTTTLATSSTSSTSSSISVISTHHEDKLLINKLESLHHNILPLYKRLSLYLLPPSSSSSSNNNKNTLSKTTKTAILYQICSISVKLILMIIEIINTHEYRCRYEMIIFNNRLIGYMKMIVNGIDDSMSMLKNIINLKKYNAFDYIDEQIKMFGEDIRLQHYSSSSSSSIPPSSIPSSSSSCASSYNQLLYRSWYLLAAAIAGLRECRRVENFDFKSVNRISTVISCMKRQGLVQYACCSSSSRDSSDGSSEIIHAKESNNPNEQPYHHHHHHHHHHEHQQQQLFSSLFQPEWLNELMSQVGIHDVSYTSSLEELSKLFPRRLPQIVALWCVETPVTYWDKVSIDMMKYYVPLYFCTAVCHHHHHHHHHRANHHRHHHPRHHHHRQYHHHHHHHHQYHHHQHLRHHNLSSYQL